MIAAATSYKSFKDVSGDPGLLAKNYLEAASQKSFAALRQAHVAEHQRLFHKVALDLGATEAMKLPTDERIRHLGREPIRNWRPSIFSLAGTCCSPARARAGNRPICRASGPIA